MDSNWKKEFKQALFQDGNFPVFVALTVILNIVGTIMHFVMFGGMPNWILFIVMTVVSLFISICSITEEMEMMEEEQEENDTNMTNMQEQENIHDIEELLEMYACEMTKEEEPFLAEIRGLLEDIMYIKNKCDISAEEQQKIFLHIPKQVHRIVEDYFEVFIRRRKELAEELLLDIREKREQLYTRYIQPYQDKVVQSCKDNAKQLKEEEIEYLYIQE